MGFFDSLIDTFLRDTYSKETLITLCKNDRRILYSEMIAQAKAVSKDTEELNFGLGQFGTCTIEDVSDGMYLVKINGTVIGVDAFGGLTDTFVYTKMIYIDQYGDINTSAGTSSVTLRKKE